MNQLISQLTEIGQSIWYDNIDRRLLDDGTLEGMIDEGLIRGITSNPSIFNKAISGTDTYDHEIKTLAEQGQSREEIYESLAVNDIQRAADLFLPLYQSTGGGDGFVSLEVSPYLAHQTAETTSEAAKLWGLVNRPNLMVKIPATREGLPAIADSIQAGLNINVTLIFSLNRYREVMDAYLTGLERRLEAGRTLNGIASVASFFISRIDSKVDSRLAGLENGADPDFRERIASLSGKAALANGKLAYQIYQDVFGEQAERFQRLREAGAEPQRILWASTSTKNPAYPDTMYVDELIGPGSVNTVPPKTLDAFLDHGRVESTIYQGLDSAREVISELTTAGIDLEQVTRELEDEGVASFADAFTALLDSISEKIKLFRS